MSVAKDTSLTVAAALAPILCTLVVTPFYLHVIGSDRFGILAISWTILSAAAFASLGIAPALTYRLAVMDGEAPTARSTIVWMALSISLAASLLVAVLALAFACAYFKFVSLPSGLRTELWKALPLLAALLPLGALSGVLNGALQGRGRFGALSAVSLLNAVLCMTCPLFAALFAGVDLPILILALVSANALVLCTQLALTARLVPLHAPSRFGADHLKGLLNYGAWMSTTALAPFLLLFDRFVVGTLCGPTAIGIYVLSFNVLQGLLLLPASLGKAMLPRLAPLTNQQDVQELQSYWLLWLNGLLAPLSIIAIAFAAPFLQLWIGRTLGNAASPVAVILLVGGWAHGIAHIPSAVLVGRSRPQILAKLLLTCMIPYMLLLYFATQWFGIVGAAATWTIRAAIDPILFVYTRPYSSDMLRTGVSGIFVLAAMTAALSLSWMSFLYWVLMLMIAAATCYQNRAVLLSSASNLRRITFGTV